MTAVTARSAVMKTEKAKIPEAGKMAVTAETAKRKVGDPAIRRMTYDEKG